VTTPASNARADRVAAQATGVGIGLVAFMIGWLAGARVTDRIWGPPSSALVALAVAVGAGVVVALVAGHRLVRRQPGIRTRVPGPDTSGPSGGSDDRAPG
jgi:divalent metal cation (Fe/Co/Zn/Cd) transporter